MDPFIITSMQFIGVVRIVPIYSANTKISLLKITQDCAQLQNVSTIHSSIVHTMDQLILLAY